MSDKINVSVIFATYNRASIITDVLNQWLEVDRSTKYTYEIICSDDASSDNTVEIIENFKGLPITMLKNEHGGASRARNAALKIARGEIVIFTGDDIFPEPDFINRHYENYLKFGDKVCTLGRIEWHKDVPMNHLMYHITNVGCEQFGFAGLIPYALTDFRHFYTSNISVSKKELDGLDKYFDLTFDKYGFEDIELGYRLFQNKVMIYYDPDLIAYHHHIYDDVDKFCNRQMSAGDQMVVFTKLHNEVRQNEVMGIYKFEDALHKAYEEYTDSVSSRGNEILAYLDKCKARTRELENILTSEDRREYRAECSALYRFVFQFSMYLGWALRLLEDKKPDKSILAEIIFDFMFPVFAQLFKPVDGIYTEASSCFISLTDKNMEIHDSIQGATEIRLDPCDMPCIVKKFKAIAIQNNGKRTKLKIKETNGTGSHDLDFSEVADPQIFLIGLKNEREYQLQISFQITRIGGIEQRIQQEIQKEINLNRNYSKSVYQTRKLNLYIENDANSSMQDLMLEYQQYLESAYGNDIILSDAATNLEFRSNYIVKFAGKPMSIGEFRLVMMELYHNYIDGMICEDGTEIYLSNLSEQERKKLPVCNPKDLMKQYPLVSVVIPSYNHQQYIGKAIESVLNQSYPNIELIIIDDGSKDCSIEVIQSYTDSRITVVKQENSGAHNAINRGLQMAKGDYLAILNSDDIFSSRRFEVMVHEMKKNPEVGFACSYIRIIDSEGNPHGIKEGWHNMEPWTVEHPERSFQATDDFKLNLLMTNFTSTTSNFLFTRELYERIGGMRNLRFAHDWDFALRAAEVTECLMIEQPLMEYRVHNTNTISSNRKWMLFEIAWMWATNIERFYNKQLFNGKNDEDSIISIAESLNLQGNDKIFWMIKLFIDAQKAKGVEAPEEILLDDAELRNKLLEYVVE